MRIVFFGTAGFAVPVLEHILRSDHEVVGVVSGQDQPTGRGRRLLPTLVKQRALDEGLPVLTPEGLRDKEFLGDLAEWEAEAAVVVAYRILPKEVFSLPRKGTLNVHPSLLPKYRGPAPLNWAVINGERETGVSVISISEKVDAGGLLLQRECAIHPDETVVELAERAARIGGELIVEALDGVEAGELRPVAQDDSRATTAPKLTREHGRIDWSQSARAIHNRIRGVQPWPGAFTLHKGNLLKFFDSHVVNDWAEGSPGDVLQVDEEGLVVATGDGRLVIREIQLEGKRRLPAESFVRGYDLAPGDRMGG